MDHLPRCTTAIGHHRYFGGLTIKEAAAALGIAPRTADAHWAFARAWLLAEIARTDGPNV